ncbi:hypothetical protein AB434_2022 [Heyndrickxia coagulans]|nr:hypothetical protein AB434_2022 [Heyndrickxia coagulans]KYC62119.1 hypothetical protein B4100_0651 [Heyndrickxia coagulans]KYC79962.1 hypothetical protein B4096_0600 [Heyndrickxia coagulans]
MDSLLKCTGADSEARLSATVLFSYYNSYKRTKQQFTEKV